MSESPVEPERGRASAWVSPALVVLGLAGAAALWWTGAETESGAWAPAFLRGYFLAWLCYVIAAVAVTRTRRLPRWALLWIVMAAIAMRLIGLAQTPPLSTDVWRYLWDGRVTNAGINPYRHAPEAPEVSHLVNENWRHINFKHIPTIYPPAAELLFAGLARVRDSDAEAFRWSFALFDMGSVLLLIALLRRTGRRPERVIWYAWCPLPVTELTAGAHVDAFGLFLLLAALVLAARGRQVSGRRSGRVGGGRKSGRAGSALALAGAVMAKGYAVLTIPFFVRRLGWRVLALVALACVVLLAPFALAGGRLFGGLSAYLAGWETNASLFLIADRMLAKVTPHHFAVARVGSIALVLAAVVWLTRWQRGDLQGLLACVFAAFGAQLFIGAPTLPWYVVWLIPALCWWSIPGLALFSLTVSAQYYARWLYAGNETDMALLWAGYTPVYALLIGQLIWWRARARRSEPSRRP